MMQTKTAEFELIPFDEIDTPENCSLMVFCSLYLHYLDVSFLMRCPLNDHIIPDYAPALIARKNGLWEHTCFEIFLGEHDTEQYREFNLSPSGAWNVYRFSGYREGMTEETLYEELPFRVKMLTDYEFRLDVTIDLSSLKITRDIETGFSAVLEKKDVSKSYWALNHPGKVPDFHAREGWTAISI